MIKIDLPNERIHEFCQRYPIRKLSLFGSVLRADFCADSDVDVLVEFDSNARVTYLDMAQMQFDLEDILGHEVDLLTPAAISKRIMKRVLQTAVTIYERPN